MAIGDEQRFVDHLSHCGAAGRIWKRSATSAAFAVNWCEGLFGAKDYEVCFALAGLRRKRRPTVFQATNSIPAVKTSSPIATAPAT